MAHHHTETRAELRTASTDAAPPTRTAFRTAYDAVLADWPGPVERTELPTPYGLTHVNSAGPADAPPLVLLPGGGATSTVWGAAVAAGLAHTHRVHAVDLVGDPGLSVPAEGAPIRTVADLMGWLDALLDGLAAGPVELAGHSYGAWIAAHYAAYDGTRARPRAAEPDGDPAADPAANPAADPAA
ncbi:alpha/beta fold hydrolase, partial [Streptomyces bambusae]